MKRFVIYLLLLAPAFAWGEVLETPNYIVKIESHCDEGVLGCDKVTYVGTSKRTGKGIKLKGHSVYRMCADGVTPCQFRGYEFVNGNITYMVTDDARLVVVKSDGSELLSEQGQWR